MAGRQPGKPDQTTHYGIDCSAVRPTEIYGSFLLYEALIFEGTNLAAIATKDGWIKGISQPYPGYKGTTPTLAGQPYVIHHRFESAGSKAFLKRFLLWPDHEGYDELFDLCHENGLQLVPMGTADIAFYLADGCNVNPDIWRTDG